MSRTDRFASYAPPTPPSAAEAMLEIERLQARMVILEAEVARLKEKAGEH